MKYFALAISLLVAGCTVVTAPPSDVGRNTPNESPLTPGIYRGTIFCEFESRASGETITQSSEPIEHTLVISESGIPMRNGQEEFVGRTERDNFNGFEIMNETVGVSAFSSGVNIIKTSDASVSDRGQQVRMITREETLYRPSGNGVITATTDMSMSMFLTPGSVADNVTILTDGDCSVQYFPQ